VEAAGVEPAICTENTQVIDTESAWNSPNSTIAWFAYKSRTKIFRNSQNSEQVLFRSIPADVLKYSLILIHQFQGRTPLEAPLTQFISTP
jgi:hypothetical protein